MVKESKLLKILKWQKPRESPPYLLDYIPKKAIVSIDESHVSVHSNRAERMTSRKETLVEYGFKLPSTLDNRPLKFEEWEMLTPYKKIYVSATINMKTRNRII